MIYFGILSFKDSSFLAFYLEIQGLNGPKADKGTGPKGRHEGKMNKNVFDSILITI